MKNLILIHEFKKRVRNNSQYENPIRCIHVQLSRDIKQSVLFQSEPSTMFDVTQIMSFHHVVVKNATTFKEKMLAMRRRTVL